MTTSDRKKRNKTTKTLNYELLSTAVFAIGIYIFWRIAVPHYMSYHEQLQLFLWTSDYLTERILIPGGTAQYMAEFVVQYFNNFNIGALLLSLLFVALQRLMLIVGRRHFAGQNVLHSFTLPLLLLVTMSDMYVMTTYAISLTAAVALMTVAPRNTKWQTAYSIALGSLGYMLIGPIVVVTLLYFLVCDICKREGFKSVVPDIAGLVVLFLAVVGASNTTLYHIIDVAFGIDYYRSKEILWEGYLIALVPMIYPLLKVFAVSNKVKNIAHWTLIAGTVVILPIEYGGEESTRLKYDMLVRTSQWTEIIKMSTNEVSDDASITVAIALAKWHVGQIETKELVKTIYENKDLNNLTYLSIIGDAYFHIGLVNASQRYTFELKELIPNNNSSGRFISRLAEISLVSGRDELTDKYLYILSHATFYKRKAERLRELLENKDALEKHVIYGPLQKGFPERDVIFN